MMSSGSVSARVSISGLLPELGAKNRIRELQLSRGKSLSITVRHPGVPLENARLV